MQPHMRRSLRAAGAVAVGLALIAGGAPAMAGENDLLTDAAESDIRVFWTDWGVSTQVQDSLIEKIQTGGLPDAVDGDPVSSYTVEEDGFTKEVFTFSDGSIRVDSMQIPSIAPAGSVSTFAVGNCQSSYAGTGYRNFYDCLAESTNGVITMGFRMSYSIVNGGYDSIIAIHSSQGYSQTGQLTPLPPNLKVAKKTENASGSAWVQQTATFKSPSSTRTIDFRALVGGDTAWTRWQSS